MKERILRKKHRNDSLMKMLGGLGANKSEPLDINEAGSDIASFVGPQDKMPCYMDPCVACEIKKDEGKNTKKKASQ